MLVMSFTFVTGCNTPMNGDPNDVNDMDMNDVDPNDMTPAIGNSGLTGKYVGSARCAMCHLNVHFNWSQTLHAQALETLEVIGQDKNENCIGCHVVGYGEEGGFVDRATTNDLAGVGCEVCHGPARDHVENVNEESLRPPIPLASEVCAQCHTGAHHPNYDEWETQGMSLVVEHVADQFEAGHNLNSCGKCHSGYYIYEAILNARAVPDDALLGQPREEQLAVECVVCHDPHMQTGNAIEPGTDRDFQLRFPEVAYPFPTNSKAAALNPDRFNLCGQCHHSRGNDWTSTSRGPHHSVQANIYTGEMPMPDGMEDMPLVLSRNSVHSLAPEQCATCHMYREDFHDEQAPAIAGHTFQPSFKGCTTAGCHPAAANAEVLFNTLKTEVMTRLNAIEARLDMELPGDGWQWSATGGPSDQSTVSDNVKKIRFLWSYISNDGSYGLHNPDYIRSMLDEAEDLLITEFGP